MIRRISTVAATVCALVVAGSAHAGEPAPGHTNRILITGYWPPTNEMLREFSPAPSQNPGMWIGENWEGLGYDVYAYFPEFPGGTGANPKGNGDFEVDYQDTAADWALITESIRPVAIITFSRANTTIGWELEPAHQRFRLVGEPLHPTRSIPLYSQDYLDPRRPSDVPIAGEPLGNIRESALPMQAIVDAVEAQVSPSLADPFIPNYDPMNPDAFDFGGGFLSGYIGYLGLWYHDTNNDPMSPHRCVAAGHIHVGLGMQVAAATECTKISLRELIAHVNTFFPPATCEGDVDGSEDVTVNDISYVIFRLGNTGDPGTVDGDADGDGAVTVNDISYIVFRLGTCV